MILSISGNTHTAASKELRLLGTEGFRSLVECLEKEMGSSQGLYLLVSLYLVSVLKKSMAKATSTGILKGGSNNRASL